MDTEASQVPPFSPLRGFVLYRDLATWQQQAPRHVPMSVISGGLLGAGLRGP